MHCFFLWRGGTLVVGLSARFTFRSANEFLLQTCRSSDKLYRVFVQSPILNTSLCDVNA